MDTKLSSLPQLQGFIKKDPESYRDDFEKQFENYKELKELFKRDPKKKMSDFYDIVMFIAHVGHCYPDDEDLQKFPDDLVQLLKSRAQEMHHEIRMGMLKALILLRNKDLLPPLVLFELCFDLLKCEDKLLRVECQRHITVDIKNINARSKNNKLNRELQTFFRNKLSDNNAKVVNTSVKVMIDLYRKGVWNNAHNVNSIVLSCYCPVAKIMVKGLQFFVGDEDEAVDESSDEEDAPDVKKALLAMKVNKKTKNRRQNKLDKVKKSAVKINEKKKEKKNNKLSVDFSALHLIYDPQGVADKIFKIFNKRNARFEVKLLMMNFVSRLVGIHQLYVANFYPTLQRYMRPTQREVVKIMTFAAQAAHPLMPPDELSPMLHCLANNFVTERFSVEVIAMGINAIRELCNRNIYSMEETLLENLLDYRTHKDKGVFMAARSLLTLFRDKNPGLLARKYRGMPTEHVKEVGVSKFGERNSKSFIPGAEILAFKTNATDFKKNSDGEYSESDEDDEDSQADDSVLGEQVEAENDGSEAENDGSDAENDGSDVDDSECSKNYSTCDDTIDEDTEADEDGDDQSDEETEDKSTDSNVKESKKLSTKSGPLLKKKEAIAQVMKMTPEERAEVATEIMSTRFLTDEDFDRIDAVQTAKKNERFRNKKRKAEPEVEEDGEIVPVSAIEMIHKKAKTDKASRLQMMREGRDASKYGGRRTKLNPNASQSNKEKRKTKAFSMIKHKVRYGKQKTSFVEKAAKLKISLKRQLKNS